jgi:hypothetical protein
MPDVSASDPLQTATRHQRTHDRSSLRGAAIVLSDEINNCSAAPTASPFKVDLLVFLVLDRIGHSEVSLITNVAPGVYQHPSLFFGWPCCEVSYLFHEVNPKL